MDPYLLTLGIVAGVSLAIFLGSLYVGARRQHNRSLYVAFAIFAFAYSVVLLTAISRYSASTLSDYIRFSRFSGWFMAAALISLIWYVASSAGVKARWLPWMLSLPWISVAAANGLRHDLIYGEILGLTELALPWGEQLSVLEASDSIWYAVLLLAQLATIAFLAYATRNQLRRGDRAAAFALGAGVFWYTSTILIDILAERGLFPVHLGDFGLLGLAIALSLQTADSVAEADKLMLDHQRSLANEVTTRTAELSQVNRDLQQEVEARRRIESVLRESEQRFRKVFDEGPLGMALVNPDYRFARVNSALCAMLGYSEAELLDRTFVDITHPEDIDKDVALAEKLFDGAIPYYQIKKRYFRKDGRIMWLNLTGSLLRDDEGNPIYGLAMIEDITRQEQTASDVRRRLRELDALHKVARTLTDVPDLPVALQRVSRVVTDLFDARYTHVITTDEKGRELKTMVGFERDGTAIADRPAEYVVDVLPVLRPIFRTGQSQVITDPAADRRLPKEVQEYLISRSVRQLLLAPLLMQRNVIGLLVIASDESDRRFQKHEISLAETLATDIAAAIANVRLMEQAMRTAASEERSRLARDLHDAVSQTIYSAMLIAESLPDVWARNEEDGQRNLKKLRQLVRGALAEMRTLLFELRPAALEAAQLDTLFLQLSDAFTGRTRIPVELSADPGDSLPVEVKIGIYRIAQETFNNIAKHSGATRVELTMRRRASHMSLTVRDNGRGFEPATLRDQGMGIRIMHERAARIGALLTVESELGRGTQIALLWPRDSSQDGAG